MTPLLCILALSTAPSIAMLSAQQPAAPAVAKAELDASQILQRVRDAYRGGPVADRVDMTATVLGGPLKNQTIRAVVTAKLNVAAEDPCLRLDLSDALIYAHNLELVAVNRLEQRTAAVIPLKSLTIEGLNEFMPSVPLPQVSFAFGKDDAELFRGLGAVTWKDPTKVAAGAAVVYSLAGTHAHGTIDLRIDGASFRLMQVNTHFVKPQSDTHTQLVLDVTVVEPGNPVDWKIDIAGRERVGSLALLRTRVGEIKVGDKVPNLTANSAAFEPWSLVDAFADNRKTVHAGDRTADGMALILFRATDDRVKSESLLKDAQAGQLALSKMLTTLRRQRVDDPKTPILMTEAVAVFEMQKFARERPAELVKAWAEAHADLPAKTLHWSLNANTTIDRVSPNAGAVMVIIHPDLTLGGIVPLEGRSADAEAIATEALKIVQSLKKP